MVFPVSRMRISCTMGAMATSKFRGRPSIRKSGLWHAEENHNGTPTLPTTLALLIGLALGPRTQPAELAQPDPKPNRPHLVIVTAEDEYKTETTLPEFAKKHLDKDFRVSFVFADPKVRNRLPGLEVLNEADVALISVRRRVLPKEQMEIVRKFVASGKPLVGIRTASHAFALLPGQKLTVGLADWPTFDKEVLARITRGTTGPPTRRPSRSRLQRKRIRSLRGSSGVRDVEYPLPIAATGRGGETPFDRAGPGHPASRAGRVDLEAEGRRRHLLHVAGPPR